MKVGVRKAFGSALKHFGRLVYPNHPMAKLRQVRGMPTRAAGCVQRDADRKAVQNAAHDRLLKIDHSVAGLVIC
jgi:hypothetical protein